MDDWRPIDDAAWCVVRVTKLASRLIPRLLLLQWLPFPLLFHFLDTLFTKSTSGGPGGGWGAKGRRLQGPVSTKGETDSNSGDWWMALIRHSMTVFATLFPGVHFAFVDFILSLVLGTTYYYNIPTLQCRWPCIITHKVTWTIPEFLNFTLLNFWLLLTVPIMGDFEGGDKALLFGAL